MSLPHAILGFLSHESMTGYDLKTTHFDGSVAHFWPADQAQIYRTLDKLAEQGFIESTIEYQDDRPNRKVYTITEAGRAELLHWLSTSQPLPIHREPFLVQLFFADQLDNEAVISLIEQQLAAHRAQLAAYQQIDLPPLNQPGLSRELAFQRLTLELGIRSEQMIIDWLETSLKTVQDLDQLPDNTISNMEHSSIIMDDTSEDSNERIRALALALTDRVGWKLLHRLLDRFGTLEAILSASADELRTVRGIGQQIADNIQSINMERIVTNLQRWTAQGITTATWLDEAYPDAVRQLEDKPLVLFWKGKFALSDNQAIAIVGTREPSASSLHRANKLAATLARQGWTIVSGLARGIDTVAHQGAFSAKGRSLGILGCGVNVIYPPENGRLIESVIANGALISESDPETEPTTSALARRNRLIAAFSRAIIIVEAPAGSGALHAARYAHELGRPVYALNNSAGNAALLKDFALSLPDTVDELLRTLNGK